MSADRKAFPNVEDGPSWPSLGAVPGPRVDGAVVMVPAPRALGAVEDALAAGVPRIWLFRGVGRGARSEEAVARCVEAGVSFVDGACPFMFLEPVRNVHRLHRFLSRS